MGLLEVRNLVVSYGAIEALHGIDLELQQGEIVSLLGANGAGKSTALRAISRLIGASRGEICYRGINLLKVAPHQVVERGIVHVPEGRGMFSGLSVLDNLKLAAWTLQNKKGFTDMLEQVYTLFPRLKERQTQMAGTLSGGEQQMLALGRALMTECDLILMDEPSMGLSPLLVKEVFRAIRRINEQGKTILLVEQNANMALKIAHRGYILENGRIVLQGTVSQLAHDSRVREAYLGNG